MKKLLSLILVLAALLALAVPAWAAPENELDPRAEVDGNTARLTCGPELYINNNSYQESREYFRLAGICGSWEVGGLTFQIYRVVVADFTQKKVDTLDLMRLGRLELNKPVADVVLNFRIINNSETTVWIDTSGIILCADGMEPQDYTVFLSDSKTGLRKLAPAETITSYISFDSTEYKAKDLEAFNLLIPAPVRADLTPVSEPLQLRIELLHAS